MTIEIDYRIWFCLGLAIGNLIGYFIGFDSGKKDKYAKRILGIEEQ